MPYVDGGVPARVDELPMDVRGGVTASGTTDDAAMDASDDASIDDPIDDATASSIGDAISDATEPAEDAGQPEHSFEELCLPLYGELMNFTRRLTGNDHATAADVVHDTLEKAFRAWPRFVPEDPIDPAHSARAWLYRIVSNTHTKVYHHRRVRADAVKNRMADLLDGAHGARMVGEERVNAVGAPGSHANHRVVAVSPAKVDSSFGDEVLAAMARLSADHRVVVELHYGQGMGCAEIARRLRIPKNTVFTRLGRAREALESLLGSYPAKAYNLRRREKKRAPAAKSSAQNG